MTSAIPFPLAEILREAVALNQALLDHNLVEAQHRTRLIVTLAEIYATRRPFGCRNGLCSTRSRCRGNPVEKARDRQATALDAARDAAKPPCQQSCQPCHQSHVII